MFRISILTSPIIQWSFASQRSGQARFDELYVSTIPEIWKNVGVCCRFYVARIVCAWPWNTPCPSSWIWKPIPAGWPVCCSGVTKNNDQLETLSRRIKLTGLLRGHIYQFCWFQSQVRSFQALERCPSPWCALALQYIEERHGELKISID